VGTLFYILYVSYPYTLISIYIVYSSTLTVFILPLVHLPFEAKKVKINLDITKFMLILVVNDGGEKSKGGVYIIKKREVRVKRKRTPLPRCPLNLNPLL